MPRRLVLLARKTLESDLRQMTPQAFLKLFFWMILRANFKDRDKLKRGQLMTTIEEMREAGSYLIGYRKQKPSRGPDTKLLRSPREGHVMYHHNEDHTGEWS